MKNLALIIILGLTSFVAKAESDIEFKEGNSYTFAGPVTEESVDAAITGISSKSVKFLILDTPGGSVDAGYRFISFLKTRQDIACVVQQAASMGFVDSSRIHTATTGITFHFVSFPRSAVISPKVHSLSTNAICLIQIDMNDLINASDNNSNILALYLTFINILDVDYYDMY
jgi:ATP-dependent protease ClpP protease subunit